MPSQGVGDEWWVDYIKYVWKFEFMFFLFQSQSQLFFLGDCADCDVLFSFLHSSTRKHQPTLPHQHGLGLKAWDFCLFESPWGHGPWGIAFWQCELWTKEVLNVMQDQDFCNANPRDQVREALSRTLAYKLLEFLGLWVFEGCIFCVCVYLNPENSTALHFAHTLLSLLPLKN